MKNKVSLDLCSDSRAVKSGDLFIALLGTGGAEQAHRHIWEAVEKGAAVVLTDASLPIKDVYPVPLLCMSELKQKAGYLAAHFYGNPSKSFPLIGITGTNGKTSCTWFIAQLLGYWNKRCGIIGTLGRGFLPELTSSTHTTPDALSLQRWLAELRDKQADAVALEVSSHALMQGRVKGTQFRSVIFTNLSRDHLDYHQNMQEYEQAKQRLFTAFSCREAILNMDDPAGKRLAGLPCLSVVDKISYGIREKGDLKASHVRLDEQGIAAQLVSPWGKGEVHSPLLGRFNLSNLLAAIAAAAVQGMPWSLILESIPKLTPPPGRMMRLGGKQGQPLVIVDYAHTPEALATVLLFLREHCKGELWTIFGCGGERDRGKRALMAQAAEQKSDRVIVTLDNPRKEPIAQIMSDILEGFSLSVSPKNARHSKVVIELDRERAIQNAIQEAKVGDLILIAGKGHEQQQHLAEKSIYFSDAEVALRWLAKKGG